jgi:fluoroacetyl-CoA thioesterase
MAGIVSAVPVSSTGTAKRQGRLLSAGMSAHVALVVTHADTAPALRSGSVPVLATPRLLALCQEASCLVVGGHLAPGTTTVDSRVQFDHLAPVPVGAGVSAESTLVRVEGRRLTFIVSVTLSADPTTVVGAGRLTRVLVDEAAFLAKVAGATIH